MAISWGAWEYGNSSAGFRVGLDVTQSSVTSASSSVTWTIKVYVEAMYNVNDEMTVSYAGNISGSSTQNLTTGSSGGTKLWATLTHTYTYSTYGSSPGSRTFTANLSGVYNGATPSKSVTVTIPARPYAKPAAPSSVTATRNSDTQVTVAWTRNATTAAPYTSVTVQRRKWANGAWGAYATVATTSSTATSFVDTGVSADAAWQYQVRSNNSAGYSAWVSPAAVKMTPAAPSGVSAALAATGTSITLAWTNNAYTGQGVTIKVQRSVAGGAYADLSGATALAETVTTFTDTAPGAGTNAYRVYAVQPTGSLTSAAGQSNTVSTTVPPLAPTNLSPNGVARDGDKNIVLSWQHNPGGDGAAQSACIIEWSNNGGTSWNSFGEIVQTEQTATVVAPPTFWANGQTILWRVKTRGVASAGYGPFSASATVTTSATPVVTVTGPATTLTTMPAVVTWTYSQAQSSAQAEWEARLYRFGNEIEFKAGTGTGASYTLTTPLEQGATYTVSVRARSAAGIWSVSGTRTFTVSLLPPGGVNAVAEYQPETGTTVLSLAAVPAPSSTRTNIATATWAPSSVSSFLPNNAYWSVTRGVAIDDHPLGIPTAAEVKVVDALAGNTIASQYNIDGLGNSTTARGGGVWVKPPAPARASVDGGTGTENWTTIPANEWSYVASGSMTSTYMQVKVQLLSGVSSIGDTTYITGVIAEAGNASPSYFDGASQWGKWSGTAGASTSTLAAANAVATTSALVERRVPGGEWVRLIDAALPNDVLDLLPATAGTTEYRVTAKSATPTYRVERPLSVSPNGGDWLFVNYGDGFTNLLRLRSNADVKATAGREKTAQRFLGRRKPVPALGQSRTRIVTATGDLVHDPNGGDDPAQLWDSPPTDWETAAQEAEVVCFRDFIGRRVFGLMSDVSVAHRAPGLGSVGFTVEETEWTEGYA